MARSQREQALWVAQITTDVDVWGTLRSDGPNNSLYANIGMACGVAWKSKPPGEHINRVKNTTLIRGKVFKAFCFISAHVRERNKKEGRLSFTPRSWLWLSIWIKIFLNLHFDIQCVSWLGTKPWFFSHLWLCRAAAKRTTQSLYLYSSVQTLLFSLQQFDVSLMAALNI